jgi:Kdo2-lipid IVA lauroyltransferase/acyltransferase
MLWLFRFFSIWPLRALHACGAALGWLVWALSPRYRQMFRANVAQAGVDFDAARPAIAHAGRFVAELPRLWLRAPGDTCLDNVEVDGHVHAVAAFRQGRGVIFVGAHCGSFELGSQALAELYGPVTAMYRPARKAWLARLEAIARGRANLIMVAPGISGIRLMHKALKANQAVGLLADQVPPDGLGAWVPFFGKPAYTMTLAARLALQNGSVLLPVSCERLPQGRGYFLRVWAPITLPAIAVGAAKVELAAAVKCVNIAMEEIVLSQPDQYLWAYARYKTPRQAIQPQAGKVAA